VPAVTPQLEEVESALSRDAWSRRVEAAQDEAERFDRVLSGVAGGNTRASGLRVEFAGRSVDSLRKRLARYEVGGVEALIDRRLPKLQEPVVTPDVMEKVRLILALHPEMRSPELREALKRLGIEVGESTLRAHLHEHGLSQPGGRPPMASVPRKVKAVPLAGAELLKAVELELGAVANLTRAIEGHLERLPAPEGPIDDDRAHRDENGQFLPTYNAPKSRTEPELGGKFDTVERRRAEKDLRAMRVANSDFKVRYRKDLALTLLPIVVDAPRCSVLKHWQGKHLGELVGYAYQPATLDKHARELKLGGASEPMREAVASFWMRQEGPVVDPITGAVIVYGDATVKPYWTRHFTRCAKVATNGRVMPAISTITLHSGSGTPLVYRAFSGQASVPQEATKLLEEYEKAAGEGTARRLVVLDRESQAVWLFKALAAKGWLYIVPLRSQVVGPNAKFEEMGEWSAYGEQGDEVCEGHLWLNDSRKGESPLRVRVAGRRRHRTGNVSWYATNAPADDFPATDVVRLYFDRWPAQEHVFRDGNGRVGLDVHHGYGKKKVDNVAVIDGIEKLDARIGRCGAQREQLHEKLQNLEAELADWREAEEELTSGAGELGHMVDTAVADGRTAQDEFEPSYSALRDMHRFLPEAQVECARLQEQVEHTQQKLEAIEQRRHRAEQERVRLAGRTQIFTVDTVLDEIMTAYKLTFMNLAVYLMTQYLGVRMEMDTLIRAVLTLPGERVRTKTTETVRIYRQPRDPTTMAAVAAACEKLSARKLKRDKRHLRFELVDGPDP